jgi:hypothetical protein
MGISQMANGKLRVLPEGAAGGIGANCGTAVKRRLPGMAVTGRMKTSHLWAIQNQPL